MRILFYYNFLAHFPYLSGFVNMSYLTANSFCDVRSILYLLTNCAGVCCVVACTVAHSAKMVDTKIPSQGFPSLGTMSCIFNAHMILPTV